MKQKIKLSQYAKLNSITYRTAHQWFKNGFIPNTFKTKTGSIFVEIDPIREEELKEQYNVVYARVSSSENKSNLDSQAERVIQFANANGWQIHKVIKEIGSGLNDKRSKLNNLMTKKSPTKIIIEHKDRLTRFGFNYLETLWNRLGTEIVVINCIDENEQDLIDDFVSLITSFCARLYGQRRSKRKTEELIKKLKNDKNKSA